MICLEFSGAALLGLVGEAASPPLCFFPWLAWFESSLIVVLEGVTTF